MQKTNRVLATILLGITCAGAGARAQIIDRILAVVGTSIITQSDVFAVMRLGIEKPPAGASDPVGAVLERLIERQLVLAEVERYAPPIPSDAEVNLRLEQIRLGFPSAAAFQAAMAEAGQREEDLRRYLRDELRILAYTQQRFGTAVQPPSEQEILDYYSTHADQFTRAGIIRPFDEAHDEARAALMAERRTKDIADWLAGLRRRANVSILYAGR